MGEKESNVVNFPVENTRLDLQGIPTETEEIMDKIFDMKKSYFSEVADAIVDDVLRNIESLNLEESRMWKGGMDAQDVICIKESIMAGMCRTMGIRHPFHELMRKSIVRTDGGTEAEYDEGIIYTYVFKES